MRTGQTTARGYASEEFTEVFRRYIPSEIEVCRAASREPEPQPDPPPRRLKTDDAKFVSFERADARTRPLHIPAM